MFSSQLGDSFDLYFQKNSLLVRRKWRGFGSSAVLTMIILTLTSEAVAREEAAEFLIDVCSSIHRKVDTDLSNTVIRL